MYVTDMKVFLLPLAIYKETKLSRQEVFEVFATLCCGTVIILVAICRFVVSYLITVVPVFYWCRSTYSTGLVNSLDTLGTVEHCTAIIIVCLPVFKPLIRRPKHERIGSVPIHTSALNTMQK